MENENVVTIKTDAARDAYLRSGAAAEFSNEDLLDAQRATCADIKKDNADGELRERYNALATEYGIRYDRGDQLIPDEEVERRERNLQWFFRTDALSVDDEAFQGYIAAQDNCGALSAWRFQRSLE